MPTLDPIVADYIEANTRFDDPLLTEMEARALRENFPIIGPHVGPWLLFFTLFSGPLPIPPIVSSQKTRSHKITFLARSVRVWGDGYCSRGRQGREAPFPLCRHCVTLRLIARSTTAGNVIEGVAASAC